MHTIMTLIAVSFLTAISIQHCANASDKEDFNASYRAYKRAFDDGAFLDAANNAQQALDISQKVATLTDEQRAMIASNITDALQRGHADFPQLKQSFHQTLKLTEKAYGNMAAELLDPLVAFGELYYRQFNIRSGNRQFSRAEKITAAIHGDASFALARLHLQRGKSMLQFGRDRNAYVFFDKAIKIYDNTPEWQSELALAQFWRGKYAASFGKFRDAEAFTNQAMRVLQTYPDSTHLWLAGHGQLVNIYENLNMRDKATEHCQAIGSLTPFDPDQDFKPIYLVQPVYDALDGEGHVIVSFDVTDEGFVRNPVVIERVGRTALVKASLEAVEKFRFAPRFQDGKPVSTKDVTYKFRFALAG